MHIHISGKEETTKQKKNRFNHTKKEHFLCQDNSLKMKMLKKQQIKYWRKIVQCNRWQRGKVSYVRANLKIITQTDYHLSRKISKVPRKFIKAVRF
jgi:hypothetical protein